MALLETEQIVSLVDTGKVQFGSINMFGSEQGCAWGALESRVLTPRVTRGDKPGTGHGRPTAYVCM